jgi:hypothetical protein
MPPLSVAGRALEALASLKFTLLILLVLGAAVVFAYSTRGYATWALAAPLFAFAVNLSAAVATNPVFRRQTPLLVFHLALIAIILLVAIGRLTYLKGQLELAEGEVFDGRLTEEESGPFHPRHLEALHFANEGFSVSYDAGVQRGATRNLVTWTDANGRVSRGVIGDQDALVLGGYRFYTSFNKGFAPAFVWHPNAAPPMMGTLHLPSYPLHEYKQAQEWTPPGSQTPLWVMLQFDEVILDPARPSEFRLPARYRVVVRDGSLRQELQPGQSMQLADGVLVFDGLRSWMGYTVFYDFTLPWLLAAGILAVLSLAAHFWQKFAARPWDK